MRIMFLGSKSCPNTPPMRETLFRAVALVGVAIDIEEVEQGSLATNDIRRGYPTPTILLNGQDLHGTNLPEGLTTACRVYPKGLPAPEEIARLLRRAMSNDQHGN